MRTLLFLLGVAGGQAAVTLRRIFRGPRVRGWTIPEERTHQLIRSFLTATRRFGFAWARSMEGQAASSSALAKRMRKEAVVCSGVPGHWCSIGHTGRSPGAPASNETLEGRIVLYLHGGGYCLGSLGTCREIVARLAESCDARVLVPEYRLAPEHPFPAAHEDCLAVYRWLLERGIAADSILLSGDSAGGGLVTGTLLAARDQGLPMPAGALLFSPWCDPSARTGSMLDNARADALDRPFLEECLAAYLPEGERDHPAVAPVRADLSGLPPLLIQVGECELFLDQCRELAKRAEEHGVETELATYPLLFHTFQSHGHELPRCRAAVDEAVDKARAWLA